jgi:hypothetical protein
MLWTDQGENEDINLLPSDFVYLFYNLYNSLVIWDLMLALKHVFTIHWSKVRPNISKHMVNLSCKTGTEAPKAG